MIIKHQRLLNVGILTSARRDILTSLDFGMLLILTVVGDQSTWSKPKAKI